MVVSRNTTATRVDSAGLIESVAINAPKIDYTGGGCPKILVEPARTNNVLYSEQFDNASWGKTNTTVTANTTSAPAPDGTTTADTITGIGALGVRLIQSNSISFTASTSYSLSVFAKKDTNDFIQLFVPLAIGGMFANFNINTGVVGTLGTVTGTAPTSSITNFGNGWYRCTINFTATTTTSTVTSIGIVTSASAIRSESNTLTTSLILWGAQLEAGSNATSYIPTVTATVTRTADVISKTGVSSLIGPTEGTIFVEANLTANTAERRIITVSNGTENQRIMFWTLATTLYANFNGVGIAIGTFPIGTAKIALGYTIAGGSTTYSIKLNNNTLITGTAAAAPSSLSAINLGNNTTSGLQLNDRIELATLFQTRLTNAQLATLTTL
jgi:hypothetical protein